MTILVFAFDSDDTRADLVEGLEDYMNQSAVIIGYGFHVTTVEFDMAEDELKAHRLGKMISKTFPEISYYVK